MNKRDFPKHLIHVAQNLLNGSKIRIDTGKELKSAILVNQGVTQRCNLLPILFNMYIEISLENGRT